MNWSAVGATAELLGAFAWLCRSYTWRRKWRRIPAMRASRRRATSPCGSPTSS